MRLKRHEKYINIPAYQTIMNITDEQAAGILSIKPSTYRDKVRGWAEFNPLEFRVLSGILGATQEILSKTRLD